MNNYRINIPKSIIPLIIIAVVLSILRVIIWGKFSFVYILWNILLAFIPFIISSLLLSFSKAEKFNKIIFVIGIFIWILFIPNAPYIITDFIHLGEVRAVPLIFDVFLLFSSATAGLILGFYSLFNIEQIIRAKNSPRITSIIMSLILLMISFGMYLGRFLRFNSWDIFINHLSVIKNIWKIFSEPSGRIEAYLYTLLFFLFLVLSYKSWKYSNIRQNQ